MWFKAQVQSGLGFRVLVVYCYMLQELQAASAPDVSLESDERVTDQDTRV